MIVKVAFLIALFVGGILLEDAYGYIDLGTGSYVFQIVLASAVGVWFVLRQFWGRIRLSIGKWCSRIFKRHSDRDNYAG